MTTGEPKGMSDRREIKCVIWDLDETLWTGILLESPAVALRPGIRDVIVELDRRGILHSIASRNDFDQAMRTLQTLGLSEYFIRPQINWGAKSVSVGNIQQQLNIGFEALLFIDDQPYERDEVRQRHPEVLCVPAEEYAALPTRGYLQPRFITEESARRRQMYRDDICRTQDEAAHAGPAAEFLQALEMRFVIAAATEDDLQRAEELTVRTHQLNATGRIYAYEELNALRCSPHHALLICELEDRYGSYGKIGLALLEKQPGHNHLRLMLMSCRVMSRGLGTILLSHLMRLTKGENKALLADFKPTRSNRQLYVAYKFANFTEREGLPDGGIVLENDLAIIQRYPPHVEVIVR